MEELFKVNEQFNYELWRRIKVYALTIESINLTRMFYGTGIEVDRKMKDEELFMTEKYLGDEISIEQILSPFKPQNSNIKVRDFFNMLSPKSENNLYQLVTENLIIDIVSIFEDYLQEVLKFLLQSSPELVLSKDKLINASDLLNVGSVEELIENLTEEKVIKTMYKSLKNIINYIASGFKIKFEVEDEIYKSILYWKEIRNLIIHNRGIVNQHFISTLNKNKIDSSLQKGEKIKLSVEEVIDFTIKIKELGNELYSKITGNSPFELVEDPFQSDNDEIIDSYYKKTPYKKKEQKIGRNDLCFCGSGKKYKHCCISK